jgi:N-acetylmuramoyl-L-alanine amidase
VPDEGAELNPSAVCGESIVGDAFYQGLVKNLKRIVRSYDDDGNEHTETLYDGTRVIGSNNVATIWNPVNGATMNWQTKPIGSPPTGQNHPQSLSESSTDEWEVVSYRAVASPAGGLAVLGGNHTYTSRKWQIWKASSTPGEGQPLWEKPYRTHGVYSWGSQLLIKAVNDDGIAVGERITGMATFWGQRESVVIQKNSEEILPDSSGAFELGASICQINQDETDSHSRLAVGGRSLWVKKDNEWLQAENPPTMESIIAIAKNGVMLGSHTIWRNGTSIPLDDLVKNQKISDSNPTPRYTNLRGYAMNGEGVIVVLADDSSASSSIQNGKKLLLLNPIAVHELHPKLQNEDDVEIKGSELPARAPRSTEMVERDPTASLDDASQIRIAWRDMKVKVGKHLVGKKITWTMTPMFIPQKEDGTKENDAKFRGKWGTAAKPEHRVAFSKSEKFGDHGWNQLLPTIDSTPDKNAVAGSAMTTVDNDGYTAIRVNLPPIGFNKARVHAKIETAQGDLSVICFEVSAIVVIDPGHGGIEPVLEKDKISAGYRYSKNRGEWTLGGSAANHAVAKPSGTLEKDMTLAYANTLLDHLFNLKDQNKLNANFYTTRKKDINLSLEDRAFKAKKNGADIYISIHFNGNDSGKQVTGTESHAFKGNDSNYNYKEDSYLGLMVANAAASVMKGNNRGVFGTALDAINDKYLGNFNGYTPCRATLWEGEFIDVPKIDELLNTGKDHHRMREDIASSISDAIFKNLLQDTN